MQPPTPTSFFSALGNQISFNVSPETYPTVEVGFCLLTPLHFFFGFGGPEIPSLSKIGMGDMADPFYVLFSFAQKMWFSMALRGSQVICEKFKF